MKWRFPAWLPVLFLAASAPAWATSSALNMAMAPDLPGKGKEGACDPFARALYKRLTQAKGEAHYIVYRWKSSLGEWSAHAIVVFRDHKGQYLGTDQMRGMPLLLAGKTPEEWVKWYNGPGEVELIRTFTEERWRGRTVEAADPAPAAVPRRDQGKVSAEQGKKKKGR